MSGGDEQQQRERVRERFTRTAAHFAKFALSTRSAEADRLVRLLLPHLGDACSCVALDVACGPGTFTRALARQVECITGLDLTPAMLDQARATAAAEGLSNVVFECGEATALPYRDAAFDLVVCAYSFHHFPEPAATAREMVRVARPGGLVGAVDLIVPEGAQAEVQNQIERARDPSHARSLTADQMRDTLESAGLRILTSEITERARLFTDWIQIAGWGPGDPAYTETRRLMELAMADDASGFHARYALPPPGGPPSAEADIEFTQTSLFVVARRT